MNGHQPYAAMLPREQGRASLLLAIDLKPPITDFMIHATKAHLGTAKFARRRTQILDLASAHINADGVRGMTLTGVARELGLDTSSVTYYFRRKEDLAAACIERTLDWQQQSAQKASEAPDARSAVRSFLRAYLDLHRADRPADAPRLALLSDLHSMAGSRRDDLFGSYNATFQVVRGWFERNEPNRSRSFVPATVVMATVHWLSAWIADYADDDFARVEARIMDLLENGLGSGSVWRFDSSAPTEGRPLDAQARFLLAATGLINRDGYHGASVEKIAAELGVSTGSFYHHLDNKDELVVACFKRSYALIDRARTMAEAGGGTQGERLARMLSSIARLQFAEVGQLLRSSAYQALPVDLRGQMFRHHSRATRHIAGVVADGIAEGSIRAVDPLIAGDWFMSLIDAAAVSRSWARRLEPEQAVADFCSILEKGCF